MDLIYGVHPVLECLRSGSRQIERIYLARGASNQKVRTIIQLARERGLPIKFESRAILDKKWAAAAHQGVVAVCAVRDYFSLDSILKNLSPKPVLAILDSIEDPRNLGAILRSCAVFGVEGIILPKDRAAGLSSVVSKTAQGALEYLKIAKVTNLVTAIEELKAMGVWVVGVETGQEKFCHEFSFDVPTALVLGNEESGLRRLIRERCDILVSIPTVGAIQSLNVSVAAGIVMYEVTRQRTAQKG
jgi:23S rRNA (guanosine2251-2'-O)-methyltransferase